jgi:threonine synthase
VNSINFSRILAQIVYYFYSYFSLVRTSTSVKIGDKVRFVTPTGNFGNILAGYLGTRMGLPVDKLVGTLSPLYSGDYPLLRSNILAVATNE